MTELPFTVERDVVLPGRPETVWRLLTTDEGFAAWWGAGSAIDPRPGGRMHIAYPDGRSAAGEVLELEPERRLTFTFGYPRPDAPIPVGGSVVEIELAPDPGGTRLRLVHRVTTGRVAEDHDAGWRYQLGLFRSLVARVALGPGLPGAIDRWHAAWGLDDGERRRRELGDLLTEDVVVSEPTAQVTGPDELDALIGQTRRHLPATVRRSSAPALNGDVATWSWVIELGEATLDGRSVARLAPDGRFREVTAFWLSAPRGVPVSVLDASGG